MPNHKLSERIMSHMQSVGHTLLQRRLNHFQAGFPLSRVELQLGVLPAKWRETVLEMHTAGNFIAKTADPVCWFGENHPEVKRAAKLNIDLGSKTVVYCSQTLTFDTDVLDEETRTKLIKYVNRLVTEERLTRMANRIIGEFFAKYGPTVSHVTARWPALALLTDPAMTSGWSSRHNDRQIEEWHRRFRDPAQKLNRYRWDYKATWITGAGQEERDWYQKYKGAMGLIDTMLAMAKILPADAKDQAECRATIRTWKPLSDDRDKP